MYRLLLLGAVLLAAPHPAVAGSDQTMTARLNLKLTDAVTGRATPARVEVLDQSGAAHVALDAVRFGGDCDMSDQGAGLDDLASTLAAFSDRLYNPYTSSTQFYSDGESQIQLPAGSYTIRVFKGTEFRVASRALDVEAGGATDLTIPLERWADMPARGWYSADDHLHIPRPTKELNGPIMAMMQAEDIHVANLLQMGKVRNTRIAPQYAHGTQGVFQVRDYILAAGQENPRTHFLGHAITLGAGEMLHDPDRYLIYRLLWRRAVEQGGINGFAHAFGSGGGVAPDGGLAVALPHDLLHFMEVLQFNRGGYESWYDVLNLGYRVAPTAGTDYPCLDQNIPGHERFYAQVEGDLTYAKWLDAVRQGRTFVTTGPVVDFNVSGQGPGQDLRLAAPGEVSISATVQFDPERDALSYLELVRDGEVVAHVSRTGRSDRIEFTHRERVAAGTWFAVRGYGFQLDRAQPVEPAHFAALGPTSHVHSAAVFVRVEGTPDLRQASLRRSARGFLAYLEDLERLLADDNLDTLGRALAYPEFDAVPPAVLNSNRLALLEEIHQARAYFEGLAGPG